MTEITFFKTGHHYDSYVDFWRLVELAGFPVIRLSDLDLSAPGVFVGSPHNGEWNDHLGNQIRDRRQRNAHVVLWNIERPSGSAGSVGQYGAANRRLIYERQVDEVWVSDRRMADETSLRYVPLGSHPDFGQPGEVADKRWLFCHMSVEVPRRVHVLKHFAADEVGPNCWPPERDDVLRRSRFALNVHQDRHPFQEPLRFALFAAWGLPILSETLVDPWPYGEDVMAFAGFDDLAMRMRKMGDEDYMRWREVGLRCRERMTVEHEFGKVVRQAVAQSVGDWR